MIRVTLDLDAPSSEHDPLSIAGWLASALSQNPTAGMVIHRIEVEREDA